MLEFYLQIDHSTNTYLIVSTDELSIDKEGSNVPRKGHVQKREVLADPLYNNKVVTKLINAVMLDGKKGVAQKIVYGAFGKVEAKAGKPALEVFETAMNNIMPVLEVKARRIGGATYQVPIEVRPERRQALALRWMVMFSRKRGEKRSITQALLLREKKTCTRWQMPTELSLTTDSDRSLTITGLLLEVIIHIRRKRNLCQLENIPWREPGISVLWRTLMPVRLHSRNVFCTIPV